MRYETNPAAELYGIFNNWQSRTGNTEAIRRDVYEKDGVGWTDQLRAAVLLNDIDQALKGLERTGKMDTRYYREAFSRWREWVFYVPGHWGASPGTGPDLGMLHGLATLLSPLQGPLHLPEEFESDLKAIADAIAADKSLSKDLREFIAVCLLSIRQALDEEGTLGYFKLSEAIRRLIVLLKGAEHETEDPESKKKYSGLVETLKQTGYAAAGNGAAALLGPLGQLGIEMIQQH